MKLQLDAVELALALYKAPREIERVRSRPLPDGMVVLFRCAGADKATLDACVEATSAREKDLIEAARFYVQHVLVADDNNPYRVLGLRNGADNAQVKEHHRLLIRYLHPDRSEGTWLDVYAERINKAWAALRTPERRAEVDRYLEAGGAQQGPMAEVIVPTFLRGADVAPPPSHAGAGRWLAAIAVLLVVAMAGALWFDSLTPQTPDTGEWVAPATDDAADDGVANAADGATADSATSEPPAVVDDASAAPQAAPDTSAAPADPLPVAASAVTEPEPPPPPEPERESEPEPEPISEPEPPPATTLAMASTAEQRSSAAPAAATTKPRVREEPAAATESKPEPERVARVEPPAPPRAPPEPPPPSRDDVEEVLQRFSSAYARGNLEQFLGLFSADARGRAGGLETIAADYQTFFADSTIRAIGFSDMQLFNDGPTTIATARFVAQITPRAQFEPVVVQGQIQFDLRRANDRVVIARLLHQERK